MSRSLSTSIIRQVGKACIMPPLVPELRNPKRCHRRFVMVQANRNDGRVRLAWPQWPWFGWCRWWLWPGVPPRWIPFHEIDEFAAFGTVSPDRPAAVDRNILVLVAPTPIADARGAGGRLGW